MDPITGGILLSLGLGALGTGLNWWNTNRQAGKQRDFQKEMSQLTFDQQLQMWNMQNEYNTPANQMSRLKDAGLNPLLAYTQATSGTASQMPQYNKPSGEHPAFMTDINMGASALTQYQDLRVKQAQIDNLKAQKNLIDATQTEKTLKNSLLGTKLSLEPKRLAYQTQAWDLGLQKSKQEINNLAMKYDLDETQLNWARYKLHMMRENQINIDKDSKWDRIIWHNLGKDLNSWIETLRNRIKNPYRIVDDINRIPGFE